MPLVQSQSLKLSNDLKKYSFEMSEPRMPSIEDPSFRETILWICCNSRASRSEKYMTSTPRASAEIKRATCAPTPESTTRMTAAEEPSREILPKAAWTESSLNAMDGSKGSQDPVLLGSNNGKEKEVSENVVVKRSQAVPQVAGEMAGDETFLERAPDDKALEISALAAASKTTTTHPNQSTFTDVSSCVDQSTDVSSSLLYATTQFPEPTGARESQSTAPTCVLDSAQLVTSQPAAAVGGAAILARLRARKAASSTSSSRPSTASSAPPSRVVFAHASQTGTAAEIARTLHAEAVQQGLKAEVMSLNELGMEKLSPTATPLLVLVASSTGDGDAPDNAAALYLQIRKPQADGFLKGMRFTLLGLGDSNYTRYMHVPRVLKTRLLELGAEVFYPCKEADEVDGLEASVDPWSEGLWEPLKAEMAGKKEAALEPVSKQLTGLETVRQDASSPESDVAPTDAIADPVHQQHVLLSPVLEQTATVGKEDKPYIEVLGVESPSPSEEDVKEGPVSSTALKTEKCDLAAAEVEDTLTSLAAAEVEDALTSLAAAAAVVAASAPPSILTSSPEKEGPVSRSLVPSEEASGSNSAAGTVEVVPNPAVSSLRSTTKALSDSRRASMNKSPRGRGSLDSPRGGVALATAKQRLLSHRPSSVMFPAREEVTVSRKDEKTYGLSLGLAPVGVDVKGAPAPIPCRVKLVWEKNADAVAMTTTLETSRPLPSDIEYRDPQGLYSKEQPFWAEVSEARYETAYWSDRKVLHLQFELSDSGMVYEAGDAVGVVPCNPPELVANTLKKLGLSGDEVFNAKAVNGSATSPLTHIPSPCSTWHALNRCVDISGPPKKSLLRILAEYCSEPSEKRTLIYFTSKAGRDAYQHEMMEHQPSLLDLLTRFESCKPTLDVLLDALPPLMPRLYSVTTSFAHSPDKVQVAMSVVRFKTRYGSRPGVATTWLDRLVQGMVGEDQASNNQKAVPPLVPIFLKRSLDFKPPQDLSKPVIMIGPGTGVAPFRGFLQNRRTLLRSKFGDSQAREGVGASWLFFGCRREDEDYLYKDDLQAFVEDKTLTQLKVAFSRAQAEKIYVQDLMRQYLQELGALIAAGGYVFVCGDGASMVKDVHAAVLAAVKEHAGLSDEEAAQSVAELVKEKRYIRDVWS
ncbi:hypothetical protein CEUSTIGMA_g10800.t1 [Chlamydomonas eustigma]|uniref:Methionine synthase reductase n=1 Tax=Chlamydomonas eustigma TaxID=1157962 RepID=A0A250XJW4_9CHLO|nr:hypothetical protein CEUSTIGMA_g10800.t1 [Chlamydomonas eustigma]|eukprot:GAX83375.1 hypothetical protein CEUSTIGMA_g10800.t1 [Chlamydomonas eustigma]